MDKFVKYFSAVDGTTDWSDIQPLFDAAFHPDCMFATADGEFSKSQWEEMVKGLVAKGAVASDFEVGAEEGDSFHYEMTVTVEGNVMQLTAKGTILDGQIVRVEPVDPAVYSALVDRSR